MISNHIDNSTKYSQHDKALTKTFREALPAITTHHNQRLKGRCKAHSYCPYLSDKIKATWTGSYGIVK